MINPEPSSQIPKSILLEELVENVFNRHPLARHVAKVRLHARRKVVAVVP